MKIFMKAPIVIAIISLLLSACAGAALPPPPDGEILALQVGTTVNGIRAALGEIPGTFIMMRDTGNVVFIWPLKEGWAFTAINTASKQTLDIAGDIARGGNFCNCKTIADLVDALMKNGWKVVVAKEVPAIVWEGYGTVANWLVALSNIMPTFVFVPFDASDAFLEELGISKDLDT